MTVRELVQKLEELPLKDWDKEVICAGYSTSFTPMKVTDSYNSDDCDNVILWED